MRSNALKHRLEGGVLYYTLMVALIVGVGLLSVILYAQYHRQDNDQLIQIQGIGNDIHSGINYGLIHYENISSQGETVDLYKDGKNLVNIIPQRWGVFKVVNSSSAAHPSVTKTVFGGIKANTTQGLYLVDNDKPLALTGKTVLNGKVYLPKSGVKRAYIEGKNFLGAKLVAGTQHQSTATLPAYDSKLMIWFDAASTNALSHDSIVPFENLRPGDQIQGTYMGAPIVVYSSDAIELSRTSFKGQVLVVSRKSIAIQANAELDGVICIAPIITIQNRFNGACQIYGTDSIHIGHDVQLLYPSAVVFKRSPGQVGNVIVSENSSIHGAVLAVQSDKEREFPMYVLLSNQSEVFGQLYTNGYLDLKGSIFGSAFVDRFIVKTPSGIYENHLMDAVIDPSQLPSEAVLPCILADQKANGIMSWWQ